MPQTKHEHMVSTMEGFDETMKRLLDVSKAQGRGWFTSIEAVYQQASLLGIFTNRHRIDLKVLYTYSEDDFMSFFEGLREDYKLMSIPRSVLTKEQQKVADLFGGKMPVFSGRYVPPCADTRPTIKVN